VLAVQWTDASGNAQAVSITEFLEGGGPGANPALPFRPTRHASVLHDMAAGRRQQGERRMARGWSRLLQC
jgi:hypothetical protein